MIIPPRLRSVHFSPAKGYVRGGNGLPSQELPEQPGMMNGEAIATVPTQEPAGAAGETWTTFTFGPE